MEKDVNIIKSNSLTIIYSFHIASSYFSIMSSPSSKQSQQSSMTELQQKQQYLREEILQKNFSPQEFIEYMNQKLNVESDISKCSMEQLKKVVSSFVQKVKKHEIHMSEFDEASERENRYQSTISSTSTIRPPVIVKLSAQPLVTEEEFTEVVKCCKIQSKYNLEEWKSKKVQCMVYSPQRKFVTSILGISTSSYLEFKVKTFGLGWQVGRRYSDFFWLRSTLKRFYPSQIIPPIPNKKAHKRLPRQIQKRMKILTLFLNQLLSYPQFANSPYVEGFLSFQQKRFEKFKKQIDSKKSFESIFNTQTQSGEVQIILNKEVVSYNRQVEKWVEQSQVGLKQLTRNSKKLQIGIIDQVNTLYGMGDQLAGLYAGADKISKIQDRPNSGFYKMKSIYVTLNNMVIEWGNILRNQIDTIETNCNVVFKYVRQSLQGFRELIAQSKQHQTKYFQGKLQLDAMKQKLFSLQDVKKWDIPKNELPYIPKSAIYQKRQAFKIMLPKQSAVLQKLKLNYVYFLSRMYQNGDTSLSLKATLLCSAMEEFTIRQKVLNQQIGQIWNEMSYNFTHAFQQKDKNVKKLWVKTQQKIRNNDEEQNQNWQDSSVQNSFNGKNKLQI